MGRIVWFERYSAADRFNLGGKNASLGELTCAGLPVPPGFAVTAAAYAEAAHNARLTGELAGLVAAVDPALPEAVADAGHKARELVASMPLPGRLDAEMREAYAALCDRCGMRDVPVAVRSSATCEDLPDASFAGEHDSYLWLRGAEEVLSHVRLCWASLFTDRAISYRRQLGYPETGLAMSVGVQQMVQPRAAGVAFTLNPHDGDLSQIAIDASWGFGEAVVSGEVNPDNYLVDKVIGQVSRRIVSHKEIEYRLTAAGRVERATVDAARQDIPCLTDEEIKAVAALARRAEKHYGCPQDVEWAVDAYLPAPGNTLLLQSRPETVWSRKQRPASAAGGDYMNSIVSTLVAPLPARSPAVGDRKDRALAGRFPSPFDITTPPGAEGWQDLYSYSSVFSEDRRDYEDSMFWFLDGVHTPEVLPPWDATVLEFAIIVLSQYNTRHYLVPPALGVDIRFLNGYAYLSPVGVTDPAEIEARVPHFMQRGGHYFEHWDELYAAWLDKVRVLIGELENISFRPLPEKEDLEVITGGLGLGSGLELMTQYNRLIELTLKLWNYHFEFLNLGYVAYLDFFGFCKQVFPGIPDQAIAKMVAGIDVDLFKPDEELKKLATLAIELGIDDVFDGAAAEVLVAIADRPGGAKWLESWAQAQEPWFNFSAGSGFYHSDKVWAENPEIPLGFIASYIAKARRGEQLERPTEAIAAERERIVSEYAELIGADEDRATFQAKLGLARTVFPYVENHNFYVEHWGHSIIWRKMRELGGIFVQQGFFGEADDVFLLGRNEVPGALFDLYHGWAVGVPSRGPRYWPPEMQRRRAIMDALRAWSPPPALGKPPEVVTEPFTVMLWGITSDSVQQWLGGAGTDGGLTGFAASPGIAEGPARVILSADGISELRDGEILVAPLTAPSWAPVFSKIAATVTDVGGIMSHAAIVCREYGLPAITGTAFGTKTIKTGQRIRVDGNTGKVTVLS